MREQEKVAERWLALTLLATVLVLSMSTWFSASAVAPQLRTAWNLSASAATWLTVAVQLGFVCGALISTMPYAERHPTPYLQVA
jgi:nitrate/nitrite transporter NarK